MQLNLTIEDEGGRVTVCIDTDDWSEISVRENFGRYTQGDLILSSANPTLSHMMNLGSAERRLIVFKKELEGIMNGTLIVP